MHIADIIVFAVYILAVLGVGFYFMRRNKSNEDYYLGSRNMSYPHVGLSVVATDVGGGFSIGLGGLGFIMGISGSWMLFTGLVGAWLAAVFLIPRVKPLSMEHSFYTMPDLFGYLFNSKTAVIAGIISAVGYLGFTGSQMMAGALLASSTFDGLTLDAALIVMGFIIVIYTVMGGIKAVIYTDTFQWILLMGGLIFIGLPLAYHQIGGYEAITAAVGPEFLTLRNISWQQFVNWGITIIPIWFVGMTLYQRIYASRNVEEAKKAWYLAGLFEWPIMAFMGVLLGLFARVAADQGMFSFAGFESAELMNPEQGLPLLLRTVLPAGLMGLMMAAYFSAVMSTADSCLVAASGNVTGDLLRKWFGLNMDDNRLIGLSQITTLVLGVIAFMLASVMETVLELMLYSYAIMVSGLLIPILGGLYFSKSTASGALWSMISGGGLTFALILYTQFADTQLPLGLDPIFYGLLASLMVFVSVSRIRKSD